MNANTIINMVVRLFMRKVLSRGMDAGIDMVTRKRARPDMDPEAARQQSAAGRENAKNAKQMMKVTRRVTRF